MSMLTRKLARDLWSTKGQVITIALVVASGLLMFATQPGELLAHRAFVLKMALLMLAGLNAAAFHARDGLGRSDAVARAQSLLSVALWIAVLGAGRWIAYG